MTRKDYKLIAAAFADALARQDPAVLPWGANALAYAIRALMPRLEADNPRFDRSRFLRACGVQV